MIAQRPIFSFAIPRQQALPQVSESQIGQKAQDSHHDNARKNVQNSEPLLNVENYIADAADRTDQLGGSAQLNAKPLPKNSC